VTHERDEGSDTSLCPVPAGALLAADSARTPGSARPLETSVAHPPRTHKHRRRPSLRGLAALAALSLSAGALASMALSGGPPLAEAVGAVEPAAAPPRRALVAPESDAVGVAERSPRVGTTPTAAGTDAAPVAARRESTSAGLPVAAPTAEGTDARPAAGEAAPSALPRLQAAAAAHATRSVAAAPTAPVVTAPPALAVAPALATPTGVAAADRNDDPSSADREGQDTRPGTLRVTVIPWGDVWVDGRYMGRAPTEVSLRPGRHVVAAGTDRPSQRRAVQLSPGQLRRVELELQP
jgi:hypothetical protein